MIAKRVFDVLVSGMALLVLLPLFFGIAATIKLDSPGPVFFRQKRVGRFGKTFRIHKFRTMVTNAEVNGPLITVGADARVTRVGAVLRKRKLDELPQLIDVLIGSMSLVGPRPEVPQYIAYYPAEARELVLSVRPGITDSASIEFKDENEVLERAKDPYGAYINDVLPIKIGYYTDYVRNRTFLGDLRIIGATICAIVR